MVSEDLGYDNALPGLSYRTLKGPGEMNKEQWWDGD